MKILTIDKHFALTAAPADRVIRLDPSARRLTLDIIELTGGASPTIKATLTERVPSFKEIEIVSADANAIDSFTPGRTIRGSQSGKYAVITSQRTASGVTYISYVDSAPSKFFAGETIREVGLTSGSAAVATVDSLPTQSFISGVELADTEAVSVDTSVNIVKASRDNPDPARPTSATLAYTIAGAPSSASWVLRVS